MSKTDTCEWDGCTDSPDMKIKFTDPDEHVYYCQDHGRAIYDEFDSAQRITYI